MDIGSVRRSKRTAAKRGRAKGGGEVQTDKEREQEMMEELAGFVFEFGERYDVILDIKVKPRKHRKGGTGDERD